jgi:isocitrate dehydrogenase
MNGDIISDLTSGLVGGLGFAPSANIGSDVAIYEAVHGSAPKYAGKDVINPTAVILTAVMMLRHLGEFEAAERIEHAVLVTLESGIRTRDIAGDEGATGTKAYTAAIIANLGKTSATWTVREYKPLQLPHVSAAPDFVRPKERRVVGVDVFLESPSDAVTIGHSLEQVASDTPLQLKMIGNRGTKVYQPTGAITDVVDQWVARFVQRDEAGDISDSTVLTLLGKIAQEHRWSHVEKLQEFDGEQGFTRAQGED